MAFSIKHCETASPETSSAVKYVATGFGRLSDLVCCFILYFFSLVVFSVVSNCWNCPAINYKFAASDSGGSVGCQEGDEFGDLVRPVRATQGNTAEHVHQLLPGPGVIA